METKELRTECDIKVSNNNIFTYCKPLSFAWSGNRLFIMNENQYLVEFGDGYMSNGKFGHHSGKFEHRVLGNIEVDDTVFKFYDYDIEFDFSLLRNSKWLDRNRVRGKYKYDTIVTHHLKRFSKKRTHINNLNK